MTPPRGLAIERLVGDEGGPDPDAIRAFLARPTFPLVEGDSVTFVFVGHADEVTLHMWIYGLESAQPLERHPGTDLWYRVVELPPSSRIEYKFGLHFGDNLTFVQDPRNPKRAYDPYGANSVCATNGYVEPDWIQPGPDMYLGDLDRITLPSETFGDRSVQIYTPPRYRESRRYPLLIVHDGSDFLRYAWIRAVLDTLIGRFEVAPMIVALIDSPDRLKEYGADPQHGRYLVEDLLPELEARYPLKRGARNRGLMGASFGAVAALSAAWSHPGAFGQLMLMSGSFVFADIGRHKRSEVFDPVADFMAEFRAQPGHPADQLFVSCGVYESLIYENRSLIPTLRKAGLTVKYQEAHDGHNWINWRDRLRDGLSWLFPGSLWHIYE